MAAASATATMGSASLLSSAGISNLVLGL